MSAARLPTLLLLTDRRHATAVGRSLPGVVRVAAEAGARAVVLREKDLPTFERAVFAKALRDVMRPVDGLVLVASDASLARSVGAAGVHLAADDPSPKTGVGLVGRSCHSADEVAVAAAAGCDYVTVSPVFETASKPGYGPALNVEGLSAMCGAATVPVYALGGIEPGRARCCLDAGAAGVAVMGAVMGATDPAAVVRSLLDELDAAP